MMLDTEPSETRKTCVIYDTGTILQATLNPTGPSEQVMQILESGRVDAVMSNRLRDEYEDILKRPSLQAKYPNLRQLPVVEGQLKRVDALIVRLDNAPKRVTFPRDPNDEHIVNLVIECQADFLVTRDYDLLDLNHDPVFRRLCKKTRIVSPVEFLRAMER